MSTSPLSPGSIPGPLQSLRWLRKNPRRFFEHLHQFGGVVPFALLWQRCYLVAEPEHIKTVLTSSYDYCSRLTPDNGAFAAIIGRTLLTTDGPSWLALRRAFQPQFHRNIVNRYDTAILSQTEAMLKRWQDQASETDRVDIMEEMFHLALDVVCQALFSTDIEQESQGVQHLSQQIRITERCLTELFYSVPVPLFVPLPRNVRLRSALRQIKQTLEQILHAHRTSPPAEPDFLSFLLHLQEQGLPFPLDDRQLLNEVLTMLLAGHETTASVLAWTWYLLAEAPEVEEQLHAELETVLAGRIPTTEDISRLPYTRMVIREAMRLYPPVWNFTRKAERSFSLGSHRIAAGSLLFLSPWVTQRDAAYWDQPLRFLPERFNGSGASSDAYFPFGKGQHTCIGNELALLEAELILATVAQQYRLRLPEGVKVRPGIFPALRPTVKGMQGLPMMVVSRTKNRTSAIE